MAAMLLTQLDTRKIRKWDLPYSFFFPLLLVYQEWWPAWTQLLSVSQAGAPGAFFRWTLRHLTGAASSHSPIMVTLDLPVSNLHFHRLDTSPTDCMLGGDTKLSLRLRLPGSPPRVAPEAVGRCEADGGGGQRRWCRANGVARSARRVGCGVALWNWWEILMEWGGNMSVWLKRGIDADGRSKGDVGVGGWISYFLTINEEDCLKNKQTKKKKNFRDVLAEDDLTTGYTRWKMHPNNEQTMYKITKCCALKDSVQISQS